MQNRLRLSCKTISVEMPIPFLFFFVFAVFGCWHPASPGQQEPVPESRRIHFCCPQPLHWHHPNFHLHPVYCGTLPGIKVPLSDKRRGKDCLILFWNDDNVPRQLLFFFPFPFPSFSPCPSLPNPHMNLVLLKVSSCWKECVVPLLLIWGGGRVSGPGFLPLETILIVTDAM